MKKLNILTYIAFALSVAVLLSGVSSSEAEELNQRLTGTYSISVVKTCYWDNGILNSIHLQGEFTFDGNGNGWAEIYAFGVNIFHPNPSNIPGDLNQKVFDGIFTYTVGSNQYFIIDPLNLYVPDTNNLVVENVSFEGWIGRGSQTLIISNTEGNIETVYNGNFPSGKMDRNCGGTGSAVKVSKE